VYWSWNLWECTATRHISALYLNATLLHKCAFHSLAWRGLPMMSIDLLQAKCCRWQSRRSTEWAWGGDTLQHVKAQKTECRRNCVDGNPSPWMYTVCQPWCKWLFGTIVNTCLQQYKQELQNKVGNRDVSLGFTSLKDSEFVKVIRIEIHGFMASRCSMVQGPC
jgi:hypothetical protein